MTRDGITLTVEQAILTSDKTVIVYKTEGIPQEARPKGESGFTCQPSTPTLHLPNGTKLNINGGSGSGSRTGFNYPPIPADVNTVIFLLRLTTIRITHRRQLEMPTDKASETTTLFWRRRADDRNRCPSEVTDERTNQRQDAATSGGQSQPAQW
jgi:hypothetical protein